MINFIKEDNLLVLSYSQEQDPTRNYVKEQLGNEGKAVIKKTFHFKDVHLSPEEEEDLISDDDHFDIDADTVTVRLLFGTLGDDGYYLIENGVLTRQCDVYLHHELEFDYKMFVAAENISIFAAIAELTDSDIIIGGTHPDAIPVDIFNTLRKQFPTTHEKTLYARARVAEVLRDYFDNMEDSTASLNRHVNSKVKRRAPTIIQTFQAQEIEKFQTVHESLKSMLSNHRSYSEHDWQKQILGIIRLLYPKYIAALPEVKIEAEELKSKKIDFLLVDFNGHVDVVEIKKPMDTALMSPRGYRDNYFPVRELSGTIMQVEKYIYHLKRMGATGEKRLTSKYKDDLPESMQLKITNPGGIIITGREHNLSAEQKMDFEVVKRKYRNVVDIITYDNLLLRLQYIIEQIKKL